LILGVAYSENFAQSLAIFGVVGAGLTIVLKEVVLSMVAWVVLMTGSMIRLGDRIKIEKVNNPIIGDVVDISLTKITLYENITNDSVTSHKRAGRIIFVPNYLIFTSEIYNYTHLSMKTIIDLVEINFSFDSNFGKAETITREVVENISGRYADMAKRQYDKLKSRYTLRNMPTYPRIVFYPSIQGDGVTMAIWYIAPYREILNLKSEITKQCITQLNAQEDIKLIYSSASVYLESNRKKSTFGSVQI
ncbi:MAG: mechanosensitive ion channel, partial [Campylobacteraceae bacterium]|nr:mechanosensitive ion channel [Campylobacteraceae bacterium]